MTPSKIFIQAKNSSTLLNEFQILSLSGIFFFAPMSVAGMNSSGVIFITLSLIKFLITKKTENKITPTIYVTIIFSAWVFLSTFWSPNFQDAAPTLKGLWWYAILPVAILTIEWREGYFKFMVLSFISGNTVNAAFFIVQLSKIIVSFQYNPKYGLVGFGNRVYLAMLAPPAVIILLSDIRRRYFISNPIVSTLLAAVIFFELAWSTGRTAQLVLAILLILYFTSTIRRSRRFILIAVAAASITIFFSPHVISRWSSAMEDVRLYISGDAQTNLGLRLAFWDAAIRTFLAHPLVGAGAGGYTPSFHKLMLLHKIPTIGPEWFWAIEPHNSFLAILAEYGAIGFLSFTTLIYVYYKSAIIEKNQQLMRFKVLILLTFILASLSDSFIWRWQGMMILLVAFSISSDPIYKKNVQHPDT